MVRKDWNTAKGSGKSMEIYFLLARNGPLWKHRQMVTFRNYLFFIFICVLKQFQYVVQADLELIYVG